MSYSFNKFVEDLKRKHFELRAEPITEDEIKELLRQMLRDHPEEAQREIVDMSTGIIIRIGDLPKKKLTSKEWIAFLRTILMM